MSVEWTWLTWTVAAVGIVASGCLIWLQHRRDRRARGHR